jgi:hypothetical protein
MKVYEALGCVADGRIEVVGNGAKVYSSSRGKFYSVVYDPTQNAIMANDNASFYVGYLGYPSIAFLLEKRIIPFDPACAEMMKGIAWKDINVQFKNDFNKSLEFILEETKKKGFDMTKLNAEVQRIYAVVNAMQLKMLGEKVAPPKGY